MRNFLFLLAFAFVLIALNGCQEAVQKSRDAGVNVVVEGGGQFPKFLVGTWADEEGKWRFTFEPDGTISRAVIDSGVANAEPAKKIAKAVAKDGTEAIYNLGQWTVRYSPQIRELSVEVVVESLRIPLGDGALGGSCTDMFTGRISDDGTLWQAEWFTFPKYVLYTPEPNELEFDPNENPMGTLMFRKQPK